MTVKELIEILDACNQNAEVYVTDDSGTTELKDADVFHSEDGKSVTFDISVASLAERVE